MSNTESYSVSDCCVCDNCMKLPGGGGNSSELAKYLLALAGSSLLFAAQADTVAWWRFRLTVTPRDCFGLSGRPLASTFAYGGKCVRRTFNAGADIV